MITIKLRYVGIMRRPNGKIYLAWNRKGHKSVSLTDYGLPRVPTSETELQDKLAHPAFVAKVHHLNAQADGIETNAISDTGTFRWLVRQYEQSRDFKALAPRTKENYRYWLRRLNSLNSMPISVLDDQQEGRKLLHGLQDQYADRPRSANDLITTLKTLIDWAIRAGHMTRNPAKSVRQLSIKARKDVWSIADQAKWLANAPHTMKLAFLLGLYTGQRQGDILSLRWDQIADGFITVTQSKTGETVKVQIHSDLVEILGMTARHGDYVLMWQDSRPGHPTEWKPFQSSHFGHAFTKITKACGLEGLQFRDLRRTLLTELSAMGVTPQQLSDVSGHRIARSTRILDTYVARNPGTAAARLPSRRDTTS